MPAMTSGASKRAPCVAPLSPLPPPLPPRGRAAAATEVVDRLPVARQEGVQVDEVGDALRHAVRRARDDHAAVAVADEDEVAQVLVLDDVDHVLDVSAEVRLGR